MFKEQDVEKRIALTAAMKKRLTELDDQESAEHNIEHHLLAVSSETADEVCALVGRLGFSSTKPQRVVLDARPNEFWYAFDVISRRDTKMPSLLHESLMLALLADAFSVIYNGSGTMAVLRS